MKYPVPFKQDVKNAFPTNEHLLRALEEGSEIVGRILEDEGHWSPNPQKVVELFDQGRQQEVYEAAKQRALARLLYSYWKKLDNSRE